MVGRPRLNLTGKRFGRLKVIAFIRLDRNKSSVFKVACDCGKVLETLGVRLTTGRTKSCGCLRRKPLLKTRTKKFDASARKVGVKVPQ